jgi:hypothetical protein
MRIIIVCVAMVAALAAPAFGKSKKTTAKSQHTVQRMHVQTGSSTVRARSSHPEWDVYRTNGDYAGTDPDPRVRAMLRRDDPNADP